MKTRIVHTKLWEDDWFTQLSRESKFCFIYLITNSRTNLNGLYELSTRQISFDLGFSLEEIEKVKRELSTKVSFCGNWIYIKNHDKYQMYSGEKNGIAKQKELLLVPLEVLDTLSIPYPYTSDTTRNQKSKIRNQNTEIQNPKSEIKWEYDKQGNYSQLRETVAGFRSVLE